MKKFFIACVLVLNIILSSTCFASTFTSDSINSSREAELKDMYLFQPNQLILPGTLLAAGIVGTYTLDGFKNTVRDHLSGYKKGHKIKIDDYIQYSTAVGYVGLGFIPGVKTRGDFRQRLMAGVTAYAVMAVTINAMKYSFKHPRPDSGTRNSFPSGHSATVFTGAELMRIEYGNYVGMAGYAVALTVGALRIYNDRHWVTDVLGGAGIGILSARIGYWLLPLERKLFKLDKNKDNDKSIAILPMIGETNGMAFSMQF
ncbi:MAG: phosphatase PAP2 family protein [Muribaculaceae bacterium]|nr:phosphatase PAP2 family protein [Muribaculaceae bacterium]